MVRPYHRLLTPHSSLLTPHSSLLTIKMLFAQDPLVTADVQNAVADKAQELEMLKTLSFEEFLQKFIHGVVTLAINIVVAIVVFYIGKFLIARIQGLVMSVMIKRRADRTVITFVSSLVRITLYFLLIIIVIGILGIETSSFIALFASAGVAIGMALSGTLQNFAGGVLILFMKPYKVGDYIEAGGFAGTVKEIQIFHTIITTADNKSILIPNGTLSNGSINNWSREDYRRVDWTVSISYGDDVETARKAILDILHADDRVVLQYIEDDREERMHESEAETPEAPEKKHGWLWRLFHTQQERASELLQKWEDQNARKRQMLTPKVDRSPVVKVAALADSSVNLTVRAWTLKANYWPLYWDINERIYTDLPAHGINFPFPQLDVHLPPQA